jgi:putative transcriptional regulator
MGSSPDMTSDSVLEQRLARLKPGCILVATDVLRDPNFDTTMILVCACGKDGAYGLVLNRPSHMPISEMFDGFSGVDAHRKIYVGGPVQQESLQIVQVTSSPVAEAHEIAPGVHMGGQWDDLPAILGSDDASLRLFLGYSGWAPNQLEQEIMGGAWEVYNVNLTSLLTGPEDSWFASADSIAKYLQSLPSP